MWSVTTLLCVAGTVFVYAVVRRLYLRYKHPLINVVGLSAAVVISALLLLDVPNAAYEPARKIMTALIGAATGQPCPAVVPLQEVAATPCRGHHCQRERRGFCGHVFRRAHRPERRPAA